MSFCDELRKIEWENSYSNKKEEIIHREVEGLITGIKVLSRNAARDGKRNLTGYYDQFYWDTTDYYIQPSVSETGFQRYTMLSFLKGYSQYEAMNIRQEIVKKWDTEMFSFALTRSRRERTKNFLPQKRA